MKFRCFIEPTERREAARGPRLFRCAVALAVALAGAGCVEGVPGSGKVVTKTREVPAFEEIHTGGAFHLEATVGKKAKLELVGDDNLLPLVQTTVKGARLTIRTTKNVRPSRALTVKIVAPTIRAISASGASKITARGIDSDRFLLTISGAGKASLEGKTRKLVVDISGAGKVSAASLPAEEVQVRSSGAAEAEVRAARTLDVRISGAGKVIYHGKPARLTQKISGAGKLVQR
jgi:hypothetical protein